MSGNVTTLDIEMTRAVVGDQLLAVGDVIVRSDDNAEYVVDGIMYFDNMIHVTIRGKWMQYTIAARNVVRTFCGFDEHWEG